MLKILWFAPNLNHYKSKLLSFLSSNFQADIHVVAGAQIERKGHVLEKNNIEKFLKYKINAQKEYIGIKPNVYIKIFKLIKRCKFDIVLIPLEKKFIFLIFFMYVLKYFYNYKLVSYNHPMSDCKNKIIFLIEKIYRKLFYLLYNRVIFYTETAMKQEIKRGLISHQKAFFANNTLDTQHIWNYYSFKINKSKEKSILFIGRLIPNKRIDDVLRYYNFLKKEIPRLKIIVIGDGPERTKMMRAINEDPFIVWKGAIVDERILAKEIKNCHLIFVPGHSGLSVVHSFCYGKPYVTIGGPHPPEIAYLKDGVNGLILIGKLNEDCKRIINLLKDQDSYARMCKAAYFTAKQLSIESWCQQMKKALTC
jgi:glycosyltransferase involved in cell wall biosynthesis